MAINLGIEKPIELTEAQEKGWMKRLIKRAQEIGDKGEVPVCALILDSHGRSIGYGSNSREKGRDPLGHAELIAIRQASRIKGDWRLNDCTLIVTLEPCQMCTGAIIQARVGQVIYGAKDKKRGGLGGAINLATHQSAHHKMKIKGGLMEREIKDLLESWFKQRRTLSRGRKEAQTQIF